MRTDRRLAVALLRWLGRILALGVFLAWGAIFVAHTLEWPPGVAYPPHLPWWVGLHLLMLVGLLVSLRWPRVGTAWTAAAALPFFAVAEGLNFPLCFGLTLLPGLLLVLCGWLERRGCVAQTVGTASPTRPEDTAPHTPES